MIWSQQDTIALCTALEPVAATLRCHVALTGGLLYKDGPRKDCDVVVYFEGHKKAIEPSETFATETFATCVDRAALLNAFWNSCGLQPMNQYSRVVKCLYQGKPVDLIFPELDGFYVKPDTEAAKVEVALACMGSPLEAHGNE